ncbi:MAG: hypothetical protein QHH10_14600, partial [Peptococcaceae bacterium]|nr:hypothetical protein [Peptococcaceae bacterium]
KRQIYNFYILQSTSFGQAFPSAFCHLGSSATLNKKDYEFVLLNVDVALTAQFHQNQLWFFGRA